MEPDRKYPVGIQTFSRLREEGYLYIDKTDLIWKMTKESPFVFLSRPRRFGKSLLTTTLDAYFKGQKELFEGLKIMDLETEWKQYPVIHIDVSWAKNKITSAELQRALVMMLKPLATEFGRDEEEITPGEILTGMIRRAYERTGKQVVVVIDEYDAPMLDSINNPELQDYIRSRVRNQIIAKDYAVRFAADTRPVYAVGLNISEDRRTIDSYKIVKVR